MTPEYKTALIRGLIGAGITAGGVFFTVAATANLTAAFLAAGAAAFGFLGTRFLGEGTVDSQRAKTGGAA